MPPLPTNLLNLAQYTPAWRCAAVLNGHRAVLSLEVANGLQQKMKTKGTQRWSSLEQYVRNCRRIWQRVGCRYAPRYTSAVDPRLQELRDSLNWFRDWRRAVYSQPTGVAFPRAARKKQFLSRETYYDLRLTIDSFTEFCEHYLPMLPPGRSLVPSRLSQDPVGAAHLPPMVSAAALLTVPVPARRAVLQPAADQGRVESVARRAGGAADRERARTAVRRLQAGERRRARRRQHRSTRGAHAQAPQDKEGLLPRVLTNRTLRLLLTSHRAPFPIRTFVRSV